MSWKASHVIRSDHITRSDRYWTRAALNRDEMEARTLLGYFHHQLRKHMQSDDVYDPSIWGLKYRPKVSSSKVLFWLNGRNPDYFQFVITQDWKKSRQLKSWTLKCHKKKYTKDSLIIKIVAFFFFCQSTNSAHSWALTLMHSMHSCSL